MRQTIAQQSNVLLDSTEGTYVKGPPTNPNPTLDAGGAGGLFTYAVYGQ